jgi:hypothetical protein
MRDRPPASPEPRARSPLLWTRKWSMREAEIISKTPDTTVIHANSRDLTPMRTGASVVRHGRAWWWVLTGLVGLVTGVRHRTGPRPHRGAIGVSHRVRGFPGRGPIRA